MHLLKDPQTGEALACLYTILLMAVYWMTEALPLPITSMIPMVTFSSPSLSPSPSPSPHQVDTWVYSRRATQNFH